MKNKAGGKEQKRLLKEDQAELPREGQVEGGHRTVPDMAGQTLFKNCQLPCLVTEVTDTPLSTSLGPSLPHSLNQGQGQRLLGLLHGVAMAWATVPWISMLDKQRRAHLSGA